MAALFRWLDRSGDRVDIAALRRDHPDVAWHTFAAWAASEARAALSGEQAGHTVARWIRRQTSP